MESNHDDAQLRRGGSKVGLGAAPHSRVWPLWPPNKVHHADFQTEVYVIASLGLRVQVCQ